MRAAMILTLLAAVLFPRLDFAFGGAPKALKLERAFPVGNRHGAVVELSHLRARDKARHGRRLDSVDGVVDFPVDGTYDPYLIGLYFTRVQLGTPPKEFYVQIDTGSDVLWVTCSGCSGCPHTSGLNIPLGFYNSGSSSTASLVACTDAKCSLGMQSSDSGCSISTNQCSYSFQYGDGSGTSGYYVSDLLNLMTVVGGSEISNVSASIVFGCSTLQTGDLTKSDRAVDGIFGFGQQDMSVISQLASEGVAPRAFSHCLKGSDGGGGILVLGEIVEPNMVYSPLVPSQPHYNVNLQSISVNGQILPIDPAVFATSGNQGTIIDSGTTLAYLAEEAYDVFVQTISDAVAQSVRPMLNKGNICYKITASLNAIFPQVSFNFAGDASMILKPEDYLLQQNSIGGSPVWCVGFQKIQGQGVTILGDLVLKDKIVVYDLAGQRIGWATYDCSSSVNVSTATSTGQSEYVNTGQLSRGDALQNVPYGLAASSVLTLLIRSLFL
uniref:Peptidase A1 domain-containing protein n=1 Tax=Kalanchoe fedtschenkoi TaxID=63787 RepID=A0A7N0RDL7_KALFE